MNETIAKIETTKTTMSFVNKMFVPLGLCFNVIEDEALVMKVENDIDNYRDI